MKKRKHIFEKKKFMYPYKYDEAHEPCTGCFRKGVDAF